MTASFAGSAPNAGGSSISEEVGPAMERYERVAGDSSLRKQAWPVEQFMERASTLLREAGYPPRHVSIYVKERQAGIARDILREAKKGYAALVLGRRGLSTLKELTLGSTAQKVVYHGRQIPVWIVGGRPDPGRIVFRMKAGR